MRRGVLVWLGTFLLLFSTAHGNIENLDATATMHAARALWLRGDSGLRTFEQGADSRGEGVLAWAVRDRSSWVPPVHWYGKAGTNDLIYVWFPIGHVWLMVPAVAAGEAMARVFPSVEGTYCEAIAPGVSVDSFGEHKLPGLLVFDNAFAAMLPALFGATSILLLFGLARAFGASRRDAMWTTVAIALGTQFFPLTRESLSDGPGLCFLLGALLATVRSHRGEATSLGMLFGGIAAGCAVLSRYPHGTLVPFLGLAILLACWRRRRWGDVLWFALGGLPFLILLLTVNYLRHGDVTDTGYPQAESWFNYPIYFGAIKILFAGGKGILWLSPVLWIALPLLLWRRPQVQLWWLAGMLFLVPMVMFSSTNGWQSGQCWGVRYVTAGIVCLLAIALPQLRPWQSHRRLFGLLFALGLLVNITSVMAPTRGVQQLAGQAVQAMYLRQYADKVIGPVDWDNLDAADHFSFLPRFSPLHANWTYALRSGRGDFENDHGQPRNGSANTIEPLFGIAAVEPPEVDPFETERPLWKPAPLKPLDMAKLQADLSLANQGLAPLHWEDRGGRHLWFVFWGTLFGIHPLLLLLPVLAAGALFLTLGLRVGRDAIQRPESQQP